MELVVTGAGGFSGSHLVSSLINSGHRVTAVTGRTRGRLDPALAGHPALNIVSGDLSAPVSLPARIDAVIHAAARSPAPGISARDMVRDNVQATARLVDYARTAGARTFIYLSSLSIYGDIAGPVVDEMTSIVNPDAYGMTKYLGEVIIREAGASLRSLSIRLPGVIGPGSVRNWLTSVVERARAGAEIRLFHPDALFNNAVHIHDLCRFIGNLLERAWSGHDVVTIAAAGETTVSQAIEAIVKTLNSRSVLILTDATKPSFKISIAKARTVYSYDPMEIDLMLRKFAAENRS
jgi:UDP-glucose 4-epimerase